MTTPTPGHRRTKAERYFDVICRRRARDDEPWLDVLARLSAYEPEDWAALVPGPPAPSPAMRTRILGVVAILADAERVEAEADR